MTIKPLSDKVVVKKLEAQETTKSGIILSAGAQQKPSYADWPESHYPRLCRYYS